MKYNNIIIGNRGLLITVTEIKMKIWSDLHGDMKLTK